MQIQTRFDIDDNVWFLGNGCVARKRITGIEIHIISKQGTPDIKYHIESLPHPMKESMIFDTKEELIKSL